MLFSVARISPASADLYLALGAGPPAAAGAGHENAGIGEGPEQLPASRDLDFLLIVDQNLDRAGRNELLLGGQNHQHQG